MNVIIILQLSTMILLNIFGNPVTAQFTCTITPTNAETVNVLVYINGGTGVDDVWYGRYCSWQTSGFPYETYAPVTVKVGGEIYCDNDNKCNCPNEDSDQVDCAETFKHVCLEQILGQDEYKKLLCCSIILMDEHTKQLKGLQPCIDEKQGLADQLSTCLANQGADGPQSKALQTTQEVISKGVDLANNTEPFFFYNDIFDKCISDDSPGWFLQKICAMLVPDTAKNISQCVDAMGW